MFEEEEKGFTIEFFPVDSGSPERRMGLLNSEDLAIG
jgi:hypothetical protein